MNADGGRLLLVGTPIGNLGDLSPRAVEVLSTADVIVCEDTRVTRKLLSHAGIRGRRLVAMHEHNEASVAVEVVALVVAGATVAVVTDAGMPGISDPGSRLVKAAASAGVSVEVVPGPSAALAALVVSGLPTDRFCFEGLLTRKMGEKAARLAAIAAEPRTVVLFESPRRVRATVDMLASVCGGSRSVAVAREMTKVHEEVWRGTLEGATAWLSSVEPRGEYVLVIGGAAAPVADDGAISAALADRLAAGEDRKTAVGVVAAALGVPKRRVYEIGLRLRNSDGMREGSR
ncbi:MAG TPA: 16S rRNA (cytidine(1402)-2'-O)-methyltransferase [Acidimicrobiales bacterium]|nr:16S rRNA (cytidine(1402)-2'-O)-methyltransferase [Acidimicrobiales bacterium]